VKVCGVTRQEDVAGLVSLGVSALGFILAPESPRQVTAETASTLVAAVPPGVARVGVVVAPGIETVRRWRTEIGLTAIQAHGEEDFETCAAYGPAVVKAVRTSPGLTASALEVWRGTPLLLDAWSREARGGTGTRTDWALARELVDRGFRILLAGGLGPDNLREAVEAVRPIAVDLNSGVERAPGVKDLDSVRRSLEALADLEPPAREDWPW
jgi:phosphoribosylanthranilate isomerase